MKKADFVRCVLCAAVLPLMLSGCPAAVVGVAGGAAIAASDKRSAGTLVEDEVIENKAIALVNTVAGDANISVTSYNRRVLLTGQVPDENIRKSVLDSVSSVDNIRSISDQMETGNPASLTSRASDAVLTAKVKTALCQVQRENFSCLDVKVVSEKGVVYMLGRVTRDQAAIAKDTVRHVGGVIRVKLIFEFYEN